MSQESTWVASKGGGAVGEEEERHRKKRRWRRVEILAQTAADAHSPVLAEKGPTLEEANSKTRSTHRLHEGNDCAPES